ncbi:tetratricopeptide repeat protein [Tolypothrix sp. FACHB-123]|uniref:tetratricopeptide repeat protein n=1 Tax=Tolypothrix sp. FACHB-123 TaxID=2692868 RepID=UPI001681DDAE|nr:tetratricopeptide repeat protein [Tolypothrix sp. FACHB-123]MBD2354429.1 tetratricopeptide repeat protein [Tolypothrix sp. FACHB-123]
MKLRRYFSVFITFLLVASLTLIKPLSVNSQANNSCQQSGIVCLDKQEIFTIRANSGSYSPEKRSKIITQKIQNIADNYSISINSIKVEEGYNTNNILVGEAILVTVTDTDGKAAGINRKSLAERWLIKIKVSIGKHRKNPYVPSIKDHVAIFWSNYIEHQDFIKISIYIIGISFIYIIISWIFFYRIKDRQWIVNFNKSLNSLRNEWRKRQREQWIDYLQQSSLQIFKFAKNIKKITFLALGIGSEIIVFILIALLIVRLIFVIIYNNFDLKSEELEELRKYVSTLLSIIGLIFLLGVVSVLLHWLSSSRGGTVVLLFEDTTATQSEEKNNNSGEKLKEKSNMGKAIADSLVEELHRISHIHTKLSQTLSIGEENIDLQRLGKFNFPRLTHPQENIESHLTDVVTFEAGKTRFSIGSIILTLKHLWPFGGVNRVISGSLQDYDSKTRLFVRLDYDNEVKAWEVTWKKDDPAPMTEKIRDLAYKVAMYLAPDIIAQTWDGFKFFTEAISSYYQYQQTGEKKHLDNAKEHCNKAYQAERKYEKLDGLFYKIGIAYFEKELYEDAKTAFDLSLKINPKSEYSYTGIGNVYYAQHKFDNAINQYELAKRVNKDFLYAYNGLGNVYFQLGEFEQARKSYEDACKKNDNYWHSHFWKPYHNLGLIYLYRDEENLTDYKKAEEKFIEAKEINKNLKESQELHPVHSGLALTYLFQAIHIVYHMPYVQLNKELSELKSEKIFDVSYINYLQKIYEEICEVSYSQNKYLQKIREIREKLEQARQEIDKAADIALDKEAYIYWNLGLITLAQIKICKVNLKLDEVCNAWKKALKIASNNQNNQLCVAIYKYVIAGIEKNAASVSAIELCINNPLNCVKKGWLKVILKDIKIISICLYEQNQPINALIQKIGEVIKNIKD